MSVPSELQNFNVTGFLAARGGGGGGGTLRLVLYHPSIPATPIDDQRPVPGDASVYACTAGVSLLELGY